MEMISIWTAVSIGGNEMENKKKGLRLKAGQHQTERKARMGRSARASDAERGRPGEGQAEGQEAGCGQTVQVQKPRRLWELVKRESGGAPGWSTSPGAGGWKPADRH